MRHTLTTAALVLTACGSTNPDATGDGSAESNSLTAAEDTGETAATSGAGEGTASASADESGPSSAEGADEGPVGEGPVIFDVAAIPDGNGFGACGSKGMGNPDDPEFSYLWAANSSQGTISKIDTQTVTELGRYIVRPDSLGSPSRTSVSSSGNVAVANRSGGLTKVYARLEDCQDTNGTPGIQTSNGAAYLPWGEEECIAWYTPFAYESQRPVAWIKSEVNPATCEYDNERLWTAGRVGSQFDVLMIDGDTGVVIDQNQIDGLVNDGWGLYGGAVDAEGNLWMTQLGSANRLVFVDVDDLTYQIYNPPSGPHWYGMTVDSDGYVWMCSDTVARFDPQTESFMTAVVGGYTGCAAASGPDGLLWMASYSVGGGFGTGVVGVNRQTLQVEAEYTTSDAYGMSVDFYGYVWTVNGSSAIRIDPATGDTQQYDGLTGAYTYSDMTGYALAFAGGGAPSG